MMTLPEMQLAIVRKLPELLVINHENEIYWLPHTNKIPTTGFNEHRKVNWRTEGLQICHEAEKLLTDKQWGEYWKQLISLVGNKGTETFARCYILATYEQRLEALCRIWWLERWI